MTRGERTSLMLALGIMFYSLLQYDVPLFMFTAGYFVFTLRHSVRAALGAGAAQTAKVFGLTLCAGAFLVAAL